MIFETVASIDYPIIDADAHVNEPADTWTSRVPAKFRDRCPRVERTEDQGDIWLINGGERRSPIGLKAVAGRSYVEFSNYNRFDEMRPGSFDPKARLADMDADSIHAQVLYPGVGLHGARDLADDPECQRACIRAYNEWMLEFVSSSGGRLVPQALVPTTGAADAEAELRWAIDHGFRGAIISTFPNGTSQGSDEDALFWGLANEARFPICVHQGFGESHTNQPTQRGSLAHIGWSAAKNSGMMMLPVAAALMFSRLFDDFPNLQVLLVESGIGWIAQLLEHSDDMMLRIRWVDEGVGQMSRMPSQVFYQHISATFITDRVGLSNMDRLNENHIMWSTDYPHVATTWPNSWASIEDQCRGLRRDLVKKLLFQNARTFYGLDYIDDPGT